MFLSGASHNKNSNVLNLTKNALSFYHHCIVTVPHDSDADFGLELYVDCIFFHLDSCVVIWSFDTVKKGT